MAEYPVPPEKIVVEDVHSRSICSGKISLPSGGIKIQSRYRGSSVGSCHDLCKYGRRNDDNVADKQGILVPANGSTAPQCEGLPSMADDVTLSERLKTSLINLKPSCSEPKSPRGPSVIRKVVSSGNKVFVFPPIVQPISKNYDHVADKKGNLVPANGTTAPQFEGLHSTAADVTLSERLKKTSVINLKPFGSESKSPWSTSLIKKVESSCKKVVVSPQIVQRPSEEMDVSAKLTKTMKLAAPTCRRKREIEINKEVRAAKGKTKMKILVASPVPSSLKPSAKRVAGNGGRNNAYKRDLLRVTGPTKYQHIARKPELKKSVNVEVPEMTSGIIERTAKHKAKGLAQNGAYATLSPSANGKNSSVNSISLWTQLPPLSNSKKLSYTGSRISRLARTLNCGHQLSSANTLSEHVKAAKIVAQLPNPIQVNRKRIPRKAWGVVMEPHREIRSRRHKFQPGRVLKKQNSREENGIPMSFRRKEHAGGEPNINKVEHKKVVLRHQDIQGKKGVQLLFNNVIRDTASKLAETQRSNVLALVGAFETVISLQDVKQLEMATC